MNQQVRCDACGEAFEPTDLREEPISEGGVRQTLYCPHCDGPFPVAHITDRGVELRAQLKAARGGDAEEYERLLTEYQAEVTRLSDQQGG